jgi:CDP-diacylglycerol--glycerol-3-phosphate 3-phosphatidyltransferase
MVEQHVPISSTEGPQPAPASRLRESLNPPNLITLCRLLFALALFVIIYLSFQRDAWWIWSAVIFVFAAATDALDGYVARRFGMVTALGRILDPFVDKIIICGTFIFLLEKKLDSGINSWMVIIVIGREMFVTSLRGFLEQHGKDFSATWSGKIKMVLQCVALTASLLSLSPVEFLSSQEFRFVRDVLLWSAVFVTAYSGVAYTWRACWMMRSVPQDQQEPH